MIYFLVYNLYLLDLGFNESFIGQVAAAMSVGTLSITFPSGWLLDYFGVTYSIRAGMLITAVMLVVRAVTVTPSLLLLLAYLSGISIGCWIVALPPFLTCNTLPSTRSWVFSLTYGSSIGTGIIAGLVTGAVSRILTGPLATPHFTSIHIKQILLFGSIFLVVVGFGLTILIKPPPEEPRGLTIGKIFLPAGLRQFKMPSGFYRLFPVLILWGVFVGSFPPFFSIYFSRQFGMGLGGVGLLSSLSQVCQVSAVMCMPLLSGRLGRVPAIGLMQGTSALILPFLIWVTQIHWAVVVYLLYLSTQVMCEPALENFTMELVLPEERNRMASLRYTTHFLMSGLAVAFTGTAIARIGYPLLLGALSLIGISSALIFFFIFQRHPISQEEESRVLARIASQQNS